MAKGETEELSIGDEEIGSNFPLFPGSLKWGKVVLNAAASPKHILDPPIFIRFGETSFPVISNIRSVVPKIDTKGDKKLTLYIPDQIKNLHETVLLHPLQNRMFTELRGDE